MTGMHKAPHQALCQICGSGFYQIHWGQESCTVCPENHYCPVSITILLIFSTFNVLLISFTFLTLITLPVFFLFFLESWCQPHSMSQWCLLSGGQLGSRLLHGDIFQEIRGHLWTGPCHNCPVSYSRWR